MASITSTIAAEIFRLDLQDLSTSPMASITKVKHLSSYNWIETSTPIIAVPGSLALWFAPRVLRQLRKDSGLVYIAQNATHHLDSPLEPLFRALYITSPSFDICSIDAVTERNNIRKLLSFINPARVDTDSNHLPLRSRSRKPQQYSVTRRLRPTSLLDHMNSGALVTNSKRHTLLV